MGIGVDFFMGEKGDITEKLPCIPQINKNSNYLFHGDNLASVESQLRKRSGRYGQKIAIPT